MAANVFTKQFWATSLEAVLAVGSSTFTASVFQSSGNLSVKNLETAAIGAGLAMLYTFIKQFSVVQVANANVSKVSAVEGEVTLPEPVNAKPVFAPAEVPVAAS